MYTGYTWSWLFWELAKQIAPLALAGLVAILVVYGWYRRFERSLLTGGR
jgi:hypothetical protein